MLLLLFLLDLLQLLELLPLYLRIFDLIQHLTDDPFEPFDLLVVVPSGQIQQALDCGVGGVGHRVAVCPSQLDEFVDQSTDGLQEMGHRLLLAARFALR
jgi:hypothetical protein